MKPILYRTVNEGVVPDDYGVGVLDCISCSVTEERNGAYELTMSYAANGIHAGDIVPNAIIKAKPNYSDNPQLFRVYKVGKNINGKFEVNAQHISYDLSGKVIEQGAAYSCAMACILLNGSAGSFHISTDKEVTSNFNIDVPSSVRSWFGGKAGSLLDVYGTADWHYDNFNCYFLSNRGTDRGVVIRYGKNLTELSQTIDIDNLVTAIHPYAVNQTDNTVIYGDVRNTGLVLDTPREVAIDFSDQVDFDNFDPLNSYKSQVNNACLRYIENNRNSLTSITNSITLNFVQLSNLKERVDLCDTVHIIVEALGLNLTTKCIKTTWDVLEERYTSCTFGDSKTNIADTVSTQGAKIDNTPTTSQVAQIASAEGKKITGNAGGNVVLHDIDGDGAPDELLIMNTQSIETASKLWRFDLGGLYYSRSGYQSQDYWVVLDDDGYINASLIKTGKIADNNGYFEIDFDTGSVKMTDLNAISSFNLIDEGGGTYATLSHANTQSSYLSLKGYARLEGGTQGSLLDLKNNLCSSRVNAECNSTGAVFSMTDENDTDAITMQTGQYGGLYIKNPNDVSVAQLSVGSGSGDGILYLFDNQHRESIVALGQTGVLTCKKLVAPTIEGVHAVTSPTWRGSSSGAWNFFTGSSSEIKQAGNVVQARFFLKGDGGSVSAGSTASTGTICDGIDAPSYLPVTPIYLYGFIGAGLLACMYIRADGSFSCYPLGSAITLSSSAAIEFVGTWLTN